MTWRLRSTSLPLPSKTTMVSMQLSGSLTLWRIQVGANHKCSRWLTPSRDFKGQIIYANDVSANCDEYGKCHYLIWRGNDHRCLLSQQGNRQDDHRNTGRTH